MLLRHQPPAIDRAMYLTRPRRMWLPRRASGLTVSGPGFTLDPREQILHIEGGAHVVTGEAKR